MTSSPASLLARLDELKKWQKEQQERLMKNHYQKLDELDKNFSSHSDYDTIAGLSEFESPSRTPQATSKVSLTGSNVLAPDFKTKTTEMTESSKNFEGVNSEQSNKPKRPFLKRGTGLTKYNMNPGDQYRPFVKASKKNTAVNISKKKEGKVESNNHKAKEEKKVVSFESLKNDNKTNCPKVHTPLKTPPLNFVTQGVWQKVDTEPPLNHNIKEAINYEFKNQSEDIAKLDLNTSEGIEKLTDDTVCDNGSNCNTDNFKINRRSGPVRPSLISKNIMEQINEFAAKRFGPKDISNHKQIDSTPATGPEPGIPQSQGEQTMYEKALEKELMVFEALEKRAMNSSFGSTNSSIIRLLSSTPQKNKLDKSYEQSDIDVIEEIVEESQQQTIYAENNPPDLNEDNRNNEGNLPDVNYFQKNLYTHNSSTNSSVTSEDLLEQQDHYRNEKEEKWSDIPESDTHSDSDCTSCISQDTTLKTRVVKNMSVQTSRQNSLEEINLKSSSKLNFKNGNAYKQRMKSKVNRKSNDDCDVLLPIKLKELDVEINNFRRENATILNLRRELEEQQRQLKKEMKRLENENEDEKLRIEVYLEEEKKKLAKDRMVFERYVKEQQNKPTKKEREEVSKLKMEVESLRETLKLKDARNGTTQARLRNQIKHLEKEITALREEIEKLNKTNARLAASQKLSRPPSDTKMLHEINKNLSKLTKDPKVKENIKKVVRKTSKTPQEECESTEDCSETDESSGNSLRDEYQKILAKSKKDVRAKVKKKHRQSCNNSENEECERMDGKKTSQNMIRTSAVHNSDDGKKDKNKIESDMIKPEISPIQNILNRRRTYSRSPLKDLDYLTNKEDVTSNTDKSDLTTFRNLSDISLMNNYEKTFGHFEVPQKLSNNTLNDSQKKDRVERTLQDGSTETKYSNGNVKTVSPDGNFIVMKYYNGDLKETKLLEGTIKYYYAENKTWHTTLPDGSEILEFPDGQTEKKYKDGSCEIQLANGVIRKTTSDGSETIKYPDGTTVTINKDGEKTLLLPNGQKEIHTNHHKRREYPDGTVKILYPDGLSETRYSNGRIRMKDRNGKLLMDTHDQNS